MSLSRTQILITDIPKEKCVSEWPKKIETLLFKDTFPEYLNKLHYFTPLPFLNRIIIILEDEESAKKVYDFLSPLIAKEPPAKLYLTESLLVPRSLSVDDSDAYRSRKGSATELLAENGKPILSLDTNPLNTGVNASSLYIGSPSLSPDKSVHSPTFIKVANDSKAYYYKEPLPKSFSQSDQNLNKFADDNSSITPMTSTETKNVTYLYKPEDLKISTSSVSVSSIGGANIDNNETDTPPKSPLITLNPCMQ